MFLQNQNVSNRDENRSIPVSDGHCFSCNAHRHTSTPVPAPESELPVIPYEFESSREIGSSAPTSNEFGSTFGVHVPGNGTAILAPNYEDIVTSSANRSAPRAQFPSSGFHQFSIPIPPSTAPPSYRNSETASPSRSLPSYRNDSPSLRSSPPPSYQEVMEGAYSELPPVYQQAILHPAKPEPDRE